MLKVTKAAFAEACFWVLGLSDVHECWGGLKMAPPSVDKQPVGYFVWYVEVKMTPVDAIWLFLVKSDIAFARHFMATHPPPTLPPCRSAGGIDFPSKKMVGYSASYPFNSWCIDRI